MLLLLLMVVDVLGWHNTRRIHHNIAAQTVIKICAVQSHHILLAPVHVHRIATVVVPGVVRMVQHLVHLVEPRIKLKRCLQVVEVAQQLQGINPAEAKLA